MAARLHLLIAMLSTAGLMAAAAPAAQAATAAVTGNALVITGDDTADAVTVAHETGLYRVSDTLTRLLPGPGCVTATPQQVTCPDGPVTALVARLNGGDDQISTPVALPVSIDAGPGADVVDATGATAAQILGGPGDDQITGTAGADVIDAGDGNDTVLAGAGDDTVHGGAGNDRLYGGEGNDRLFGDAGDDLLSGDAGDDVLHGGDGNDALIGGNPSLRSADGSDQVYGDAGNDVINTIDGHPDLADGGPGRDTLKADRLDTPVSIEAGTGVGPAAQLRIRSRRVLVRSFVASVRVLCPAAATARGCVGRMSLLARAGRSDVAIASAPVRIGAASDTTVRVRLSMRAIMRLRRTRVLTVAVTSRDLAGRRVTIDRSYRLR